MKVLKGTESSTKAVTLLFGKIHWGEPFLNRKIGY
jgi:hypothetical protein